MATISKSAADLPARLAGALLGQLLLAKGLITSADLEKALAAQPASQLRLGRLLVRLGAISEDTLLPVLAEQLALGLLSEEQLHTQSINIARTIDALGISPAWCAANGLAIFESTDGALHCACRTPQDSLMREVIAALQTELPVVWQLIRSRDGDWLSKLLLSGREEVGTGDDAAHLRELAEEAPVIELVNTVFSQAADENASDIHIEPDEFEFHVRLRIDGVLQTRSRLPIARFAAVASRIKLIAALDIAERRLPQDGRMSVRAAGTDFDVRVSVVPGVHGESVVMRLLPKDRGHLRLDRLGLAPDHLVKLTQWAREPNGIVLVTGPTGSGKSTTLYAVLAEVNDRSTKIITVEDPVEYRMRGVTQIQAQAEIGYGFARALRAILRQDPDIIMIGEIRDLETAEIAVQSALTGHTVFSTLHTNDALSAFTRLIDMGVEPFLVVSAVRAVQAQRLVRRLCAHCAQPETLPEVVQALWLALTRDHAHVVPEQPRWLRPVGCPQCQSTGFRGRLGIYEMLDVTPNLQAAVMRRAPGGELATLARSHGYRNLREDGLLKAAAGLTSIDEVLRVTGTADPVED
ncbi:MAG: type II/IV secretion system protein [Rhodoferax sp.]|nr:type II/IV secretion system protein [Rhodoferax sp.]